MIEKHLVAFFHSLQIVTRLKIADAGPVRLPVLNEIVPRIGLGLLLDHPVVHNYFAFCDAAAFLFSHFAQRSI